MGLALADTGWQARLELGFERYGTRTVLARRRHSGPLVVQRPFYPEGDPAHVYLLHPPGGVVGGDILELEVDAARDTHVLITTPAAGKFYRSIGPTARVQQRLQIGNNAVLEWLPQENIVFSGARVRMTTRVELDTDSRFIGWEILCLGRTAGNQPFTSGAIDQRIEITRSGLPLCLERQRLAAGDAVLEANWGLAGHTVTATLLCTTADTQLVTRVREALPAPRGEGLVSVTLLEGMLVCRYTGNQAAHAKSALVSAWETLRPAVLGRRAESPRVWNT